jgi:hypothetical protein
MAERDENEGRGFKVQDRRRFTGDESGAGRAEDERRDEREEAAPSSAGAAAAATARSDPSSDAESAQPLAEMTFSTFVMGLTTQALMHLGEIADPASQQVGRDLPAAKQMIDLLGILRDKTKGNLDAAEEQLLGTMLYDLRMRYVEVVRSR